MLKSTESMKEIEVRAEEALKELIAQVPVIKLDKITNQPAILDRRIDFLADLTVAGKKHILVCEVKSIAQPRHVRYAIYQLRENAALLGESATPILIAPYLSPEAQALCNDWEVGFLDLEGNAKLVFGSVFIERKVPWKPAVERREIKSLFKPKSAQVLRVLLRVPERAWRVVDLASESNVSLGHVSNVRTALLGREWAKLSDNGLVLSHPDDLLDAWREAYESPATKQLSFYTTLHGHNLEEATKRAFQAPRIHCMFGSFSAASWLAPFARTASQHFYADNLGLEQLRETLNLSPATKGENVVVSFLGDRGLFLDTVEPAPGVFCTSAVQTYLDLANAGERGREAAEHLRLERLDWST